MMQIEDVILENLLHNDEYTRRVLPFLKDEYFSDNPHSIVFNKIVNHFNDYNNAPTQDELLVEITNQKGIGQGDYQASVDLVNTLARRSKAPALDWLIENTETFCKDRALYNAVVEAASLIDNKQEVGKIPDLMKDALSVSFDNNIGHDFSNQIEERYRLLHQTQEYKVPFDLECLNVITGGGLSRKTLNVIVAGTGAGKSLLMCHMAARSLLAGQNVLYISMEMAEERISERIDANILNMSVNDLPFLSQQDYVSRLSKKLEGCTGRMIVKEYPTASASVNHFRSLLNELKLKKEFTPDIIFVDYLNICASARFNASMVNSYQYVKAITEEVRGLAQEYNVPIVSATQFNRNGQTSSDADLGDISDSSGISMTVDLLLAMIRSEELDEQNLVMFKQLKNRYGDMAKKLRFVCGIDRDKMRLYDTETDMVPNSSKSGASKKPQIRDHQPQDDFDNVRWNPPAARKPSGPRFTNLKVEE